MTEIYKTELIKTQLSDDELKQLEEDFERYKETGIPADCFGRDAPYNHVNTLPSVLSAELQHVHLLTKEKAWPNRTRQFNKTSDNHLVYCSGYYSDQVYLLIAILTPDAHAQLQNRNLMYGLAEIAESFRNEN